MDKWYNKRGCENMQSNKKYYLIRTILIFSYYIFGSIIFNKLFSLFGLNNSIIPMIIADIIFFIIIVFIYREKIKICFNNFKEEYSLKNKIFIILKWCLIILSINMLMAIFKKIFSLNINNIIDENSTAVIKLFDLSFSYSLFKALLFAPIAEELLFKESIRDIVKNDIAFLLISSSIYTAMNFMYSNSNILFLDLIKYFMLSLMLSLVYIKNKDNIVIVMVIKFLYNIIPTIILIITMIVGVNA